MIRLELTEAEAGLMENILEEWYDYHKDDLEGEWDPILIDTGIKENWKANLKAAEGILKELQELLGEVPQDGGNKEDK